ncbi:MAG: hypothetical protein IPN06_04810, partial [Burkholderiales bacterium]|nr:hypothetical protein [Burkholderiales bacterium]
MTIAPHWLIDAAQRAHPEVTVAPNVAVAPNLSDAWAQVCGLFHIGAAELTALVGKAHGVDVAS